MSMAGNSPDQQFGSTERRSEPPVKIRAERESGRAGEAGGLGAAGCHGTAAGRRNKGCSDQEAGGTGQSAHGSAYEAVLATAPYLAHTMMEARGKPQHRAQAGFGRFFGESLQNDDRNPRVTHRWYSLGRRKQRPEFYGWATCLGAQCRSRRRCAGIGFGVILLV